MTKNIFKDISINLPSENLVSIFIPKWGSKTLPKITLSLNPCHWLSLQPTCTTCNQDAALKGKSERFKTENRTQFCWRKRVMSHRIYAIEYMLPLEAENDSQFIASKESYSPTAMWNCTLSTAWMSLEEDSFPRTLRKKLQPAKTLISSFKPYSRESAKPCCA